MRLIDADALNKELHSLGGAPAEPATWDDGWDKAIDEAICLLNRAPTIDAEPVRHGRWILKHVCAGHYWECSECHKNPCIYVTENTKFCPNCGAKMDGGDTHA